MQDIFIKSLMSDSVTVISPDEGLEKVIQEMLGLHCSCLVVIEDGIPVGIVTERNLVCLLGEGDEADFRTLKVKDIMSQPAVTVIDSASLFDALVLITNRNVRHLPVVNDSGRLVGLVTLYDLAKHHFRIYEKPREIIEYSISARTRELLEANERLKAMSLVDGLLGIGNRRAMETDLEYTHSLAVRHNRTYSVALFDIDFFKHYNDRYGHLAGDKALQLVAEHLQNAVRKSDRLYRYGGEEILLILPETPLAGAEILVRRVIAGLAGLSIPHQTSPLQVLTMSCGIVCQNEDGVKGKDWRAVVELADQGLYQAKKDGRNRHVALEFQPFADTLKSYRPGLEGPPSLPCQ